MPTISSSIAGPSVIGFDAVRDDGQLITFWLENGALVQPPGISLRLQQRPGGFSLTNAEDEVEHYDLNGTLQSITTRAGATTALTYDASGRLSIVEDSFGRRLSFAYDALGRLWAVTRE